ncbi:MAG TPA: DUF983 domain-containing protein, partial [Trueperaceae bacterium]|nr:DUF983 domain-containing protein [Trueperaceae bacterium]
DGRLSDRKAMLGSIMGRCPNCGEGSLFMGLYKVREKCEVCAVRFERDTGAWLGAMVVAYALAVVAVVITAAVTIIKWGLYQGLEWVLVATGVVSVLALYRPVKGFWIWSMWAAGLVVRDDEFADRQGLKPAD